MKKNETEGTIHHGINIVPPVTNMYPLLKGERIFTRDELAEKRKSTLEPKSNN
jgi:hypothetical protein